MHAKRSISIAVCSIVIGLLGSALLTQYWSTHAADEVLPLVQPPDERGVLVRERRGVGFRRVRHSFAYPSTPDAPAGRRPSRSAAPTGGGSLASEWTPELFMSERDRNRMSTVVLTATSLRGADTRAGSRCVVETMSVGWPFTSSRGWWVALAFPDEAECDGLCSYDVVWYGNGFRLASDDTRLDVPFNEVDWTGFSWRNDLVVAQLSLRHDLVVANGIVLAAICFLSINVGWVTTRATARIWGAVRRRRRVAAGCCASCGYPRGVDERARCPECGTKSDPALRP